MGKRSAVLRFFSGSFKKRGQHAFRNLIIGALNAVLVSLVFVGLWFAASVWADEYRFGLLHWLQDGLSIPVWVHALGAVLLLDAWSYAWHRINHEIPFFWRLHRVHHSRWQPETDSNYSALFSFWDQLAQTFRLNPDPESIRLGLDDFDSEEDQTVTGMLKMPSKNESSKI